MTETKRVDPAAIERTLRRILSGEAPVEPLVVTYSTHSVSNSPPDWFVLRGTGHVEAVARSHRGQPRPRVEPEVVLHLVEVIVANQGWLDTWRGPAVIPWGHLFGCLALAYGNVTSEIRAPMDSPANETDTAKRIRAIAEALQEAAFVKPGT